MSDNIAQTVFETGAVRSADRAKQRYDLITPIGLRRVAETYHEGSKKYTDFNWEKGMPISDMLNHAIPHIYAYLAGDRSEDHLAHAAWNLLAALHSEEVWPELNQNLRPTSSPLVARLAELNPPPEPETKSFDPEKINMGVTQAKPIDKLTELRDGDWKVYTIEEGREIDRKAALAKKYELDPGLIMPNPNRPRTLESLPTLKPGVYQLFGGGHNYTGEIRYIDDRGTVFIFEGSLKHKVGGVSGGAYTDVTYDYVCSTVEEFNNKGLASHAKTLVDNSSLSPENTCVESNAK